MLPTILACCMALMCVPVTQAADKKIFSSIYLTKIPDTPANDATRHTDCKTDIKCSAICLSEPTCESAIFNFNSSTCMLYNSTVTNLVQSSTKSHLKYLESRLNYLEPAAFNVTVQPVSKAVTSPAQFPGYNDCQDYFENGYRTSGVYQLELPDLEPFDVWCDFDSTNGWTVIQRRQDGSVDFYLYWEDYKNGFGNVDGEYWLGNDGLHALTQTNQKLHIYLEAADGSYRNGYWSQFYISDESDNYRLTLSADGYSGDAEDQFSAHNGAQFSTRDRDNDNFVVDCATDYVGGWWFNGCYSVLLNGAYQSGGFTAAAFGGWSGINWCCNWKGYSDSLLKVRMSVTRY